VNAPAGPMLEAESLGRWYGQVTGLADLTLRVERGITGLVGPNGAGKSTFLKLAAGEIRPSRGSLRVLGLQPFANREYFRRVGFCPQQESLYDDMTGLEMVTLLMRLHGFGSAEARRRASEALDRVGLGEPRKRRIGGYSKGMRQRTKLAQAIAHSPELLIADEPLNGLDPVGRAEIQDLFAELARAGASVLVSSHVLHEVEALTENVVLFLRGRLLAQGTVSEVRKLLSRHPRRIEVRAREPRRLAKALVELDDVTSVRLAPEGGRLTVETSDVERFFGALTSVAARERAGILSLESHDASLEAVFDYLVG
jgi:ABC-2 type transport system ATP-binding protein